MYIYFVYDMYNNNRQLAQTMLCIWVIVIVGQAKSIVIIIVIIKANLLLIQRH